MAEGSNDQGVGTCRNGHAVAEGSMFCAQCGAAVEQRTTPRCGDGHEVQPGHQFCSICGLPVTEAVASTPETAAAPRPRRRLVLGVGALVVVLVLLGVGAYAVARSVSGPERRISSVAHSSTTASASTSSTTSPSENVAAAQAALGPLVLQFGSTHSDSGVVPSGQGLLAAVSYDGPSGGSGSSTTGGLINVYRWDGTAWADLATLGVGVGLDEAQTTGTGTGTTPPIAVEHYTSPSIPDFDVGLVGGDHAGAVVVSDVGGNWHLLPIQHKGDGPEFINPTLNGMTIIEHSNDCTPNCAQGSITATTFAFNVASGEFSPSGPPQTTSAPTTTAPKMSFSSIVNDIQSRIRAGTLPSSSAVPDASLSCPVPVPIATGEVFACNVSSPTVGTTAVLVTINSDSGSDYTASLGSNRCVDLSSKEQAALRQIGDSYRPGRGRVRDCSKGSGLG